MLTPVIGNADIGTLGSYQLSSGSTTAMAAGLAGASPIWSCRYAPTRAATDLMVVRRVKFEASCLGTAFTAGVALFNLFVIRGYTVNDTGGAALTTNTAVTSGKLRTTDAISGLADFRASATATLSAGTQTVDTNPLRMINVQIPATTTNYVIVPIGTNLYEVKVGERPLVLANNEGLVIRATVPATGTWAYSVGLEWDEVTALPVY